MMWISGRTLLFYEGNGGCHPFTWEMGEAAWGAPVPGARHRDESDVLLALRECGGRGWQKVLCQQEAQRARGGGS